MWGQQVRFMGQKTHPRGLRLALTKKWQSTWFSKKKGFSTMLLEDKSIRDFLAKKQNCQSASEIKIRRLSDKVEVIIVTPRPGIVIGKKGQDIDVLKKELRALTGKEIWIEVEEVKRPDLVAKLVAETISNGLQRRSQWRKLLKKAIQTSQEAGAEGTKVQISGRIGGAEIARKESYKEGQIPLHTLKNNIDYGTARAETTYGSIGVKVWINHGLHQQVNS